MEMQTRYTPPTSFRETTIEAVADFVEQRVLCTLIATTAVGLHASHLPVVAARHAGGGIFLEGHVARENLPWRLTEGEIPAIVIFANQEVYGIDRRATDLTERPPVIGAVHLHGRVRIVDDEAWIARHMKEIGQSHLAGTYHPWNPATLTPDINARLNGMTIGVVFEIDRVEASQRFPIAAFGETLNDKGEVVLGPPRAQRVCTPPSN